MNRLFWIEVQKCWRLILTDNEKKAIINSAANIVKGIIATRPPKRYKKNPLYGDEEDDE